MVTFHTHGLANGRLLEDRPVDGAESAGRPYGWSAVSSEVVEAALYRLNCCTRAVHLLE